MQKRLLKCIYSGKILAYIAFLIKIAVCRVFYCFMGHMSGNKIIDKSNQELIGANIFDKQENNLNSLSDSNELAINDKVEQSYQGFLDHMWDGDTDDLSNDFNVWLDKNVDRILEKSKLETIKTVNGDIEANLKALEFEIELTTLETEITEQKDKTKEKVKATLGKEEFDLYLFSGLNDKKDEVLNAINNGNYTKKLDIINFLKEGKVKEIQSILVNSDSESLPKYGDDGKFGQETFDALNSYISANKLSDGAVDGSTTVENGTTVTGAGTDVASGDGTTGGGSSSSASSSISSSAETTTGGSETTTTYPSSAEVGLDVYGGEDEYKGEIGSDIELAKGFPDGATVETMPFGKKVKLENGKLKYNISTKEETFRLMVSDKTGKLIYNNVMFIGVVSNGVDADLDQDNNGKSDEFNSVMGQLTNIVDKDINIIGNVVKKLRENYDTDGIGPDRKIEIELLVDLLLAEQERLYLKKQLNRVSSGKDKNHTQVNDLLNDKFKNDYTINIGGKDLKAEVFLDLLDKGKIGRYYIVDLDVELDYDYFDNKSGNNRNYDIKNLVISDNLDFGANERLTRDQEIQYKAEAYTNTEKSNTDIKNDRQAIKNILGIRGLFGLGGVNEDMSISTADYNTNNPVYKERKDLKSLKQILMAFVSDKNDSVDVKEVFKNISEKYASSSNGNVDWDSASRSGLENLNDNGFWRKTDKKQLVRLGKLYTKYMKKEGGDYFKKAMGLLDNYFVKGLNDVSDESGAFDAIEDNNSSMFQNIYNAENIGRVSGLIDPDKKRQAIKSIFKDGYKKGGIGLNINLGVGFDEGDGELKDLKKITKKIDLVNFFQKLNASGGDLPYDSNKWEKKFFGQYQIYKDSVKENNIDDNGNFIVDEDNDYYNAVFDFLVGVGEGRQNIVEAVNGVRVMNEDMLVDLESNENDRYKNPEEKQFVMLLSDLNFDGRTDFGDRGVRMGLEFKNLYKSVKVDQKYMNAGGKSAWENLIDFSKELMKKNGQNNLLSDLESKGDDLTGLIGEFNKNPGLLKYLQNTLVNSPIPVEYILRYGSDATEEYLMPQVMSNNIEIAGLEEKFEKEYRNLLRQGLKDTPELRAVLKPIVYGAIVETAGVSYGYGGAGLSLDTEKLGTFSLNLGYGDIPGAGQNGETAGVVGVLMSWGNDYKVSDKTTINTGISAGSRLNEVFIPLISAGVGIKTMINENQLDKNLKPKSAKYFDAGVNVAMAGVIPTWGLSVGLSQDKIAGIDAQYENIKNELDGTNGILFDLLTEINLSDDRENVIREIQDRLEDKFGKTKGNDSEIAAINLYRGLSYYNISKDGMYLNGVLDKTDHRLTKIIHDMTENYASQWKNESIRGSKNVHLDSVGVGVQFLAGFVPMPMVYANAAWYKNLYSTETKESISNYYAQLATGKGMNRIMTTVDKKEFTDDKGNITDYAIDYLNAKMSISHPDIDVSDLNIKKGPIEHATITNGEPLDSDKNEALYIPVELYKYVNINISSDLRKNIKTVEKDGNGYIMVPTNTKMALLDYSRTNTGRFNLIVGDIKAEMDDIQMNPDMDKYEGDPMAFESVESYYMDEEKINNGLSALKDKVSSNSTGDILPLSVCEDIKDGFVLFDLDDDLASECVDMGGTNSKVKLIELNGKQKLIVPENGTLTIYKNSEDKFEMYYSSIPNQGLSIEYKKPGYTETIHTRQSTEVVTDTTTTTVEITPGYWVNIENGDKLTYKHESTNLSSIDMFDENESFGKMFEGIEDELSEMEDRNYASFMHAAANAGVDNILDQADYDVAFDKLTKMLDGDLDDAMFDDLRNKIESTTVSKKEKIMIVDRFKSIFSYHIDLTDGNNDGSRLEELVRKRGDVYKSLDGYDRTTGYPLDYDYRSDILDGLKNKNKLDKKEINNLIGFTAFYRLGEENKGRGYSMTQMGSTNVLDGKLENIKDSDLSNTKERFWNNLDESEVHKDLFKKALVAKVKGGLLKESDLTDENLKRILSGKNIDINGGLTSMKLEADYVFYLLGECANESIGLEIQEVELRTITRIKKEDGRVLVPGQRKEDESSDQDVDNYRTDDYEIRGYPGGDRSVDVEPEKIFADGGLYVNTVESKNELAWAKKGSAGIKLAAAKIGGGEETIEKEPDDTPWSDPGENEPADDPWSNPGDDGDSGGSGGDGGSSGGGGDDGDGGSSGGGGGI